MVDGIVSCERIERICLERQEVIGSMTRKSRGGGMYCTIVHDFGRGFTGSGRGGYNIAGLPIGKGGRKHVS